MEDTVLINKELALSIENLLGIKITTTMEDEYSYTIDLDEMEYILESLISEIEYILDKMNYLEHYMDDNMIHLTMEEQLS